MRGFRWMKPTVSFSSVLLNQNTLATSCEELTHWKRPWCWEGLGAGGEGDDRGWDGWMVSPTWWTWVWVNSGSWWWTERPGVLRFMGLQRVGHDWATEPNWNQKFPKCSGISSSKIMHWAFSGWLSLRWLRRLRDDIPDWRKMGAVEIDKMHLLHFLSARNTIHLHWIKLLHCTLHSSEHSRRNMSYITVFQM